MDNIKFIVKKIFTDVNIKEKDISIIFSDDNGNRINKYVVINRDYKEDENGKIRANSDEYINTSFYNIKGKAIIKTAYLSLDSIIFEIEYKEKNVKLEMDISQLELNDEMIKYFKFILKGKIEFIKEKIKA